MTKKIFQSIFLVSFLVLIACLSLVVGMLYNHYGNIQKTTLETELTLTATAMENAGPTYLYNLSNLKSISEKNIRFTHIAADGKVLFDTQTQASAMENHADRKEIQSARQAGDGESSRYSATLLEETLYHARLLSDGTVLRISTNRLTIPALLMKMLQPILLILAIALLFSYWLAKRMAVQIVGPLNNLDLTRPLENTAYDEIAPLLTHIEQQHRQIAGQKEELAHREKEFYTVIKNMKEGLILLNREKMILSMNPAATTFFAADESFIGRDFLSLERSREVTETLDKASQDGYAELQLSRAGREYQFNASRIEEDGKLSGLVILIFDNTEKAFSERNRKEFTSNISHELKTPLHAIMGSAELMENGLVRQNDLPRFIGHIRTEAARLVSLIEDILRLSQLDEKKDFPAEEVDLYDLAHKEMEALLPTAAKKHIKMSVEGDHIRLKGSRHLLHETIYNLLDNAIKYNVEGGNVTLTLHQSDHDVSIAVADTGIGIPPEQQSKVFERFYRVDKSHSKESGGTGLGLSIVKHAVQHMHGTIHVDSVLNAGTTITITLKTPQ
ncbi:MAG: ATP-binding protein [Succiniclasticum sp.]|nr:ATP-binding protein [Succiniclasticum sp.]